jgi:hypothetical protein
MLTYADKYFKTHLALLTVGSSTGVAGWIMGHPVLIIIACVSIIIMGFMSIIIAEEA